MLRIWSHDVSQVYLQSFERMLREVYFKPLPDLNIPEGKLIPFLNALYGLPDSADYWNGRMAHHQYVYLGINFTCTNQNLYFKNSKEGILIVISGILVDDSLHGND